VVLAEGESPSFVYDLFVVTVREEFVPVLNAEHRRWMWAETDDIGPHLHPGCALALVHTRKLGGF
jgi:hypothetical protein